MIPEADFLPLVRAAVRRFRMHPPNDQQQVCILHPKDSPLMIAAGPGTGKTTVLVLRALRLIFVDGLLPEEVVITTFTRKAAQELRSRLIEWGLLIHDHVAGAPPHGATAAFHRWLSRIDINRFVTGTLDSLCEEILTTHRDPADPAPVLVEGFVGNALLIRNGLFPSGAHTNVGLAAYLANFTFDGSAPRNFGETVEVCRTMIDRLIHDEVDVSRFQAGIPHTSGRIAVADALTAYRTFMDRQNQMDFARLEEVFLQRLRGARLQRFTTNVRALLVDEYQDTTPLQESIYLELVRQTAASFTVVGDDDQSLYRFRGATVELFRDFQPRFQLLVPGAARPQLQYLIDNYRSTPDIVSFFNDFVRNDIGFASARVQPPKPPMVASLPPNGIPVLGMFRPDAQTLATHLTGFLWDVFRGQGRVIDHAGQAVQLTRNANGGDFGDAVVLSHSVNEYAMRFGSNAPRPRLPRLLRDQLRARGASVFNPRGQALRDIPEVQQLLGTLLECIDPPSAANPDGPVQTALVSAPSRKLRAEADLYLREWRRASRDYVASDPHPAGLRSFVRAWQARSPQTTAAWPPEWPLLELCFKLICWIPLLRDDPEGQVYLEAITRCIAQAATYSPYRATIVHGRAPYDTNSIRAAILDVLSPLAESNVEVDEEIMPHVPRTRLPFMTVHQAKGLEFPLVVLDVASDYTKDHPKNRFRRFPDGPSSVQQMEDDLAPYCSIGPLRTARPALSRSFDDLVRLYYVALSRAQSALLLVGLDPCLKYAASIKHVATGWRSDGTWSWRSSALPAGSRRGLPAMADSIPLKLI